MLQQLCLYYCNVEIAIDLVEITMYDKLMYNLLFKKTLIK